MRDTAAHLASADNADRLDLTRHHTYHRRRLF
jgi:hypothetical protein